MSDAVASGAVGGIGPRERDVLLALADDEHLMGQRHTEWIGVAPFLEEDLAFASIGQDELGHAMNLYALLDDDVDQLALRRSADDYRSCWLVEAECTDWAEALVRHWLYDEAEVLRWEALAESSLRPVRDVAHRALAEEVYHRRHATALLDALWTESEASERLLVAIERLMPLAVAMFDEPPGRDTADPAVVGHPLSEMSDAWAQAIAGRCGRVDLHAGAASAQRRRTVRSVPFAEVYSRMREVLMLDPHARW